MSAETKYCVKFGLFDFDPVTGELKKGEIPINLQAQPAKVLGLLIHRAGELVKRQEIQQHVWGDNFVEFDQGLNFCIRQIRMALGDQADAPVYIETVPRQGYRFIAPVSLPETRATKPEEAPDAASQAMQPPTTLARRKWFASFAIFSVVLLAVVLGYWLSARRVVSPTNARQMLVVLPFDNLSPDAAQEFFSDGLTEELITQLARLNPERLGVIARTSALRYKKDKPSVDQIKRELSIDYLLEGSVRAEADRLRITAQLIRASDQSHVWANSFDRPQKELLNVQREIADAVAQALALTLLPQTASRQHNINSAAREAHLKGKYQLGKPGRAAAQQALAFFQQAIQADPNDAAAYAGLAAAQMRQGLPAREQGSQVRASLQKALLLDDTLAEAHALSAQLALRTELNWTLARQEFERALALEPGRAATHHEYAFYFSDLGQHDEAIARLKKALELDPVSPLVQGDLGWLYERAKRYDEAVQQGLKTLELEPTDIGARYCLFHTYLRQGKQREALAQAREVMRLAGAKPEAMASLEQGGLAAYQRWELQMLLDRGRREYLDPAVLAMTYADLGETEKAIQCLQQAARDGSNFLASLRSEPRYDPLRADPRFAELLTQLFPQPE
ncbi:MAG: winged helix-turn-helix domain-containing protein [Blastocatellales bacterium]|nr:winged helix-turn-helix domain-containing protein [Nitrosomonas nitrosa]